jgi:hypothetical protein
MWTVPVVAYKDSTVFRAAPNLLKLTLKNRFLRLITKRKSICSWKI